MPQGEPFSGSGAQLAGTFVGTCGQCSGHDSRLIVWPSAPQDRVTRAAKGWFRGVLRVWDGLLCGIHKTLVAWQPVVWGCLL